MDIVYLLSMFNREIAANGYLTQLGLFHDNMFNSFNLSSDLMEPFRPLVDHKVYKMNPDVFEKDEKHELLRIVYQELTIAGKKEVLDNAVKLYVKSVFDALEMRMKRKSGFTGNELSVYENYSNV